MYKATSGEKTFEIVPLDKEFQIDGEIFAWDLLKISDSSYHVLKDNTSYQIEVVAVNLDDKTFVFKINGEKYKVILKDKMDLLLEKLGLDKLATTQVNDVKAPMPGLILSIGISEGDEVKKGDTLLILEAMKMENVLKAPGDGIVKAIKVGQGDSVEKNQVLIQF